MKQLERPHIFSYSDHISFLKDWFSYLKKSKNDFSLRTIAQKSEIAVGYLPMVLSGKRSLSEKAFQKILPLLHLSPQEQKFLTLLRQIGESPTHEGRISALNQMSRLKAFQDSNSKDIRVYEYLTKWYYVAIRELVLLSDFQMETEWIQQKIQYRLSKQEVEEALKFLIENKFIIQSNSGRWEHMTTALDCREGVFKISLGQFHRQMLEMAGNSIEKVSREKRYILGHTVAVSPQDFEKIREILEESVAKMKLLNDSNTKKSDVYHIEIAAFPLTREER